MKDLPVGRQNFSAIIEQNLLYVDKTQHIYNMIMRGNLYFLSRPRRFGKSLTVSTLRYIFEGRKDLFMDLYIGKETDYQWEEYPVVQFNFSDYGHKVTYLEDALSRDLADYAVKYNLKIAPASLSETFRLLVTGISEKIAPVVILIDEYDKPIVDFLTELPQARENKTILRSFFSALKGLDANNHLRFLFVTGVSKFSKVSLFSDLNNLTDLSQHPYASELTGITEAELLTDFTEHIEAAVAETHFDRETLLRGIRLWYNGYSFDGKARLYNPFSLLHFFQRYEFGNYWFATGTPTFLVESISERNIRVVNDENIKVSDLFFNSFSMEKLDSVGLLWQSGHLTITGVEQRKWEKIYCLGYPNLEVEKSLIENLFDV